MVRHTLSFAGVQGLTPDRLHHVNTHEAAGSSKQGGEHPATGTFRATGGGEEDAFTGVLLAMKTAQQDDLGSNVWTL
jgi:hypothetical protein